MKPSPGNAKPQVGKNTPMDFDHLVELCRLTHEEMQKQAVRAVDLTLVVRNWLFGRYLVEYEQNGADRAAYGAGIMDALTSRLKPLGIKGVSATRLRLYRSFYREYGEIQPTLSGELAKPALSSAIQPTPSVELAPAPEIAAELVNSVESLIRRFPLGWSHYVELVSAPTVRPMPAQGNALSSNSKRIRALKRRSKNGIRPNPTTRRYAAPSGLNPSTCRLPKALPWAGLVSPLGAQESQIVELTLPENANIFASKYQLYLPSKEELKARLEQINLDLEGGA